VKTSGRRGLHVAAPFEQFARDTVSWAEARTLAEVVCRRMAADSPDRYTVALPKAQRRGRLGRARIEEEVVVTKDGCEDITNVPSDRLISCGLPGCEVF
jgi:hypothetical protein